MKNQKNISPVKRSVSILFLSIIITGLVLPIFLAIVFWIIRSLQGVDVEPFSNVVYMAAIAGIPLYIPFFLLAFIANFALLRINLEKTGSFTKWYYFFTGAFVGLTLTVLVFLTYVLLSSTKIWRIEELYFSNLILIIPLSLVCTYICAVIGWIVGYIRVKRIEHATGIYTNNSEFKWIMAGLVLLLLFIALSAALTGLQNNEVPCMTGETGPGSLKQQNCIAEHIPGFGGWHPESRCTLIAYLTDHAQEEAARAILEPFFKEMRPDCGNRVSLIIKKGQYEFAELRRWTDMASLHLPHGLATIHRSPFSENRIGLFVEKDDMIPRVKQVLREQDIPVEAFDISSRESELKAKAKALASFSTAPEIRRSESGEHVVVPAVRMGGRKATELIMGETSLHEVLRMLPPYPGHGPKKHSEKEGTKLLPAEIQQVLGRLEQGYVPALTQTIVGFDRKKKLVFVQNIVEREQAERFADELDTITDMSEVHRDPKTLVKQGKLTPCVIVRTTAIVEDSNTARVNGAAYFFTCKTKR